MQYYNIALSILLLIIVAFVYQNKRFSHKAQAFIVFLILIILMSHYMILMNVKLFKPRKDRLDDSFLRDLDYIKNTDQNIYETTNIKDLNSCIDLHGVSTNLKTQFTGQGIIVIQSHSNIPIKEMVYNSMLDRYKIRQMANFYMNFQTYTPQLSIFNLHHLESKLLHYKILKDIQNFSVLLFHNIKDYEQLITLLTELKEYQYNKLFIVLINDDLKIPKDPLLNQISCYDLDTAEFKRYVQQRQPKLNNLTTDEIIDAVGKDPTTIENLFASRSKLSKSDLDNFIDRYGIELRIQDLDDCSIMFLKNMLVEYYKISHKSQAIPLRKLIHNNYNCNQSGSIKSVLKSLTRRKIVVSSGKNVRFYSTVVRNAVMRYFKDSYGVMTNPSTPSK